MSNKVSMNSGKKNNESKQKIKVLTLPVMSAITLILDMDEYPKLNNHIKSFVIGIKTHISRPEIKKIILEMFGNKPFDEFKVLYEKEYNILTDRFGIAIWG